MVVNQGDGINVTLNPGSTGPVMAVSCVGDIAKVDRLRLAILATTSKASPKPRGCNGQSRRGEQKVDEKGRLGDYGVDEGTMDRLCSENLKMERGCPRTFVGLALSCCSHEKKYGLSTE